VIGSQAISVSSVLFVPVRALCVAVIADHHVFW
jgi:hypothetical protein